jgi:purine-nucleoside phosphorylase
VKDPGDVGSDVERAAAALIERGFMRPEVAVVLGSGLSSFADGVDGAIAVPYSEIPGYPHTGVVGHRGAAVGCTLGGKSALVFAGRVHHYERLTVSHVTFGVRLAAELGAGTLVITNASGGIDPGFDVGDLMLIADQISVVGGPRRLPPGTFRMAGAYSERLRAVARAVAADEKLRLREGVYMGSLGPTYETPAEIAMARRMGASAVGMSTVSEVQAARSMGLEVLGVSLITNVPLPGRFVETTHEEVLEAGLLGAGALLSLVSGTLERL